jgi:hypothetical protein
MREDVENSASFLAPQGRSVISECWILVSLVTEDIINHSNVIPQGR